MNENENRIRNAVARQNQMGVKNYNQSGYNQQSGYKNYDPTAKTYDPRGYDLSVPNDIGLFTITVTSNAFGATENFILFDAFQPIEIFNLKGYVPAAATTFTVNATNGDLVYTKAGNTIVIHCNEIPYYSLVKSSQVKPFHFHHIRYSSLTSAQQALQLLFVSDQNFLGKSKQNSIMPKNFFTSQQFQALTIDIDPLSETVNAEFCIESSILNC
jgi:hypothetical protein